MNDYDRPQPEEGNLSGVKKSAAAQKQLDELNASRDSQKKINRLFHRVFNSPDGELVLAYLKKDANAALDYDQIENGLQLAHREGKRHQLAIIDTYRNGDR